MGRVKELLLSRDDIDENQFFNDDENDNRRNEIWRKLRNLNISDNQINCIFSTKSLDSIEVSLNIINNADERKKKNTIQDEFFAWKE